jgi:hypothetical protein
MLKKPIEITILEMTKEEAESRHLAQELGLPVPEVEGEEIIAYFYTIDCLLPHPDKPELTIIISSSQEFITKATVVSIIEAINRAL